MEVSTVEVRRQRVAPGGDTLQRTSALATGLKVLVEAFQIRLAQDWGSDRSEGASTSFAGPDPGLSALAVPVCQQPQFRTGTSAVKAFLSQPVSS